MDSVLLTWIVLAALFAVVELATTAFVALYLSLGAIAAAIVAAAEGDLVWQIVAFVITGIVLMVATRPVLKRRLETPDVPMNVHQVIGKTGLVTITVDNDSNTGQIRVGSDFWTARRLEDSVEMPLPVGTRVRVMSVQGVTARVEPLAPVEAADLATPLA